MRIALLGPVRALADDGAPIDIGGARVRMLLARLALDTGKPVSVDSLVDGLWGTDLPSGAANALQSLVSRLRRALRGAAAVESSGGGYVLDLPRDAVDAHLFGELVARGSRELAAGRHEQAAAELSKALALWRGEPLSDVQEAPFARVSAARFAELRVAAAEDRFDAEIALGHHAAVLADLEEASEREPLRERLLGLRIRALCAVGRQSEALGLYERLRAALADDLGVDPSPELREIHLAAVRGQLAGKTSPRKQADDHLPVRLTSFVGRDDELRSIGAQLAAARLVSLIGPGGAGKTRLATEAAARHPCYERGRVWFVPLAGIRDADALPAAVLSALGVWDIRLREQTVQPVDALDRITDQLAIGDALLVLDNCEHLIDAAAAFTHDLLSRVPGLRVLVTSREPLAITGEALCQVGPLGLPSEGVPVAEAPAVRLFTDRAATVRPEFVLDESTADAVVEICRRLDGMPLALELAAARLRSMTPGQIAKRLDDRFRLLTSGSRVALPRQRTLRAVVEWSWELLTEHEAMVARRFSVFAAGATATAVEAVCACDVLPAEDVVYVLGSLVEKSIVDSTVDEAGEPRYRMLETIRAYAMERLEESGEKARAQASFGEYFRDLLEEIEPTLRTADQLHAMDILDTEYGNLITTLRHAIDSGDIDTAHRVLGGLFWYWVIRGVNDQLVEFTGSVLDMDGDLPPSTRTALRAVQLVINAFPGGIDIAAATEIAEESLRTGAIGRYPGLMMAIPMLAFFARELALAETVVDAIEQLDDPWCQACAAWVRSFLLTERGELERGEDMRNHALRLFEQVGDRWGIAITLGMKAEGRSLRGDHAAAISTYQRGLELALELSSDEDVVQHLVRLAEERIRSGDLDGAAEDMRRVEELADRNGSAELKAMSQLARVKLIRAQGRFAEGHRLLDKLDETTHALPMPSWIYTELLARARVTLFLADGKPAEARAALQASTVAVDARQDMPDAAVDATLAANLLRQEGNPEAAAKAVGLSHALRGMLDLGDPELRELIGKLEQELGGEGYERAFATGRALSKEDAMITLRKLFS
ncbi:BTAD domain-containing putative transcriptional regulator [Amycolatopsis minnesotensis]|uniref:BTAD domain-containing putative transcriptional regulator n=1 Tax=Amycolatopsis minnesotensis TaxID=337894 RepID=A0ABN2Q2I5_9PSEU